MELRDGVSVLADTDGLVEALLDLGVSHQDIEEPVRLSRQVLGDDLAREALERGAAELVRDMGTVTGGVDLPRYPGASRAVARWFPLYVFVAALPFVRAYHRERGISGDVSRRTLADVGRGVAVHRRWHGTGGIMTARWLSLHLRGELYQLGRLQFQRGVVPEVLRESVAAAGFSAGEPALGLHIPDFMGPLSPESCDRSLARAREFFAAHFPEEPYRIATCGSWLLDPQLKRYLPADSNIVRFQERFHVHPLEEEHDMTPVRFVFGSTQVELAELPRRTVVERAVVEHLEGGGHWYGGEGWFALEG
ncbi:acyltransferase domain-containing protein [Streptomyces niveiscabiei]|uniref:acyltransferase domain-containing protein n=2 Tax=Streptomyces niveiscabiei TaxID=164115 RepID=UPI003EBD0682